MELAKNFKTFNESNFNELSIDDLLNALTEYGKDELDPYFVNELDKFCFQYSYTILENAEEDIKPGDLAKATAKQIGRAAVFGWVVGKIITKVIDPTATKLGQKAANAGKSIGTAIGTGAKTAGSYINNKTDISKKLSVLNKKLDIGKEGVKNLLQKAKQHPVRTAGISIGIILAVVSAHKMYKVVQRRMELEAEREELIRKENQDLRNQINTLSKNIESLKSEEIKIKIEYEQDLKKETENAIRKIEKDPEYSVELAKKANAEYTSIKNL